MPSWIPAFPHGSTGWVAHSSLHGGGLHDEIPVLSPKLCQCSMSGSTMPAQVRTEDHHSLVYFSGYVYRVLDGTHPENRTLGSQDTFMEIPSGWRIAPNEPSIVKHVVVPFPWGTQVIVLGDGSAWHTGLPGFTGLRKGEDFLVTIGRNNFKPNTGANLQHMTLAFNLDGQGFGGIHARILIRSLGRIERDTQNYCKVLLSDLWDDRKFCDCEVSCGEVSIPCHRAVLAKASPVFDRMLSSGMVEAYNRKISISASSSGVAEQLVKFIYTGFIDCDPSNAVELLELADYFQIDSLLTFCAQSALDSLSAESVSSVVRVFRSLRGKQPELENMWNSLLAYVRDDDELFTALALDL